MWAIACRRSDASDLNRMRIAALATDIIEIEPAGEYLLPIVEVIPLQLFSYFMALEHGVDVDKPRNLSKAVIEV